MSEIVHKSVDASDSDELRGLLADVCAATNMGFAAIARVTDTQWIACLVEDRIEFGLDPGDELKVQETICQEIRDCGEAAIFDDASIDIRWSRHPVPVLYGFKSYCSLPVYLDDGSFFGTLCALDPEPRGVDNEPMRAILTNFASRVGKILSTRLASA